MAKVTLTKHLTKHLIISTIQKMLLKIQQNPLTMAKETLTKLLRTKMKRILLKLLPEVKKMKN